MRPRILSIWFGAVLLTAAPAAAQAWTPPAGSGSVTVVGQKIDNTGHLLTNGMFIPLGKSRDASIFVEADYAVTDRWLLSAGIPFVFARYTGAPGDNPPGPVQPGDACRCWHGAWQDASLTARYGLVNGALGIAPFVSMVVPSHAYSYRGEAVPGRRLREAQLGVAVGRRLDALSPRLSVQGSYSYAIVQRVLDLPNNRSNTALEAAFRPTRRVSLRGFTTWQRTHGGLRAGSAPPPDAGFPWGEIQTEEAFLQHDRLLRDNHLRVGTGLALSLQRVDLFGSYIHYARGTDSHAGDVFTGGVSYPFEWHPRRTKD